MTLILYAFAFVCAVLAALGIGVPSPSPRPHLGWTAIALYLLALILGGALGVR